MDETDILLSTHNTKSRNVNNPGAKRKRVEITNDNGCIVKKALLKEEDVDMSISNDIISVNEKRYQEKTTKPRLLKLIKRDVIIDDIEPSIQSFKEEPLDICDDDVERQEKPKIRKNKRKMAITEDEDADIELKKERMSEHGDENDDESRPQSSTHVEVNNPGLKMMFGMGYKEGQGLGAHNQGRTMPVIASMKQNRRGIGLIAANLNIKRPDAVWTVGMDEASEHGDIVAAIEGERLFLDERDLASEIVLGQRLDSIEEETRFCDPELLTEMLKCKTLLDQHTVFTDGRSRSNPYEKIGAGIFLNRAAMKMANMDGVMKGLFTKTRDDETLFFADICAGPGGFTEYMLWRRPLQSCGFGFTLKSSNDFKLRDIICGPVECFYPSYGKYDDGDIFNEDNMKKFQQEVLSGTNNLGVHTTLADGGFSVAGKENIQEILSKQLYLCQFLCAINILRIGGNFVCKLFDVFTDFSVGLIHLVSALFRKVSIVKPITSRPANSERYIIFEDFLQRPARVDLVRSHLYLVNKQLSDPTCEEHDVLELVSRESFCLDEEFLAFIKDSNDTILRQQIVALTKLHYFILDANLVDDRQYDIRQEALKLWSVPDIRRDVFRSHVPPASVKNLVKTDVRFYYEGLRAPATKTIAALTESELRKDKFAVRNHVAGFVSGSVMGLTQSTHVIVRDRRAVRWYPTNTDDKPQKLTETTRKWLPGLPAFTILLVHFGTEYSGPKCNVKWFCTTVVDAVLIYGEDISGLSYSDRMTKVANLCDLLDPKRKGRIKPLDFFPLSTILSQLSERQSIKKAKGRERQQMISAVRGDHAYPPGHLLIVNVVKSDWMVAVSKSCGATYYYNVHTRASLRDRPDDLYANYSESNVYEVDWVDNASPMTRDLFLQILRLKL